MFNYEKLAVAEAQIAELQKNLQNAEAHLEAERHLREQTGELYNRFLSDKDATIERQRTEIDVLKGKISLMETIMMPLSSRAGSAYISALNPPEKSNIKFSVDSQQTDWQRYKRKRETEIEQEYDQEPAETKTSA